jgi:small ligand-binding sensory domain FIST
MALTIYFVYKNDTVMGVKGISIIGFMKTRSTINTGSRPSGKARTFTKFVPNIILNLQNTIDSVDKCVHFPL